MEADQSLPSSSAAPLVLASILSATGKRREQLLSSLRHELRTPMNHIIGYGEMLIEDAADAGLEHWIPGLKKIHHAGTCLLALINELFAPHKLESCPENGMEETCSEMRALARRIIACSETLQNDRHASCPESFIADLDKIRAAALRLINHIDGSTQPPQNESSAPPPSLQQEVSGTTAPARHCNSILVVDDNEANRDILARRLERMGHLASIAINGRQALEIMAAAPFDLVLLDVMMPEMDGHETLCRIKSQGELRHIPVVMISALNEVSSIARCIEMGAEDYIPKPFDPVLLKARVGASLEKKRLRDQEAAYRRQIEEYNLHLEKRVREQVGIVTQAQMGTIFALSKLAESRDPETGAHLERVREYCKRLATVLGKDSRYHHVIDDEYVENLYIASPLHDIGKVCLPDHILLKPGKHTDEEFAIMKSHAVLGANTLREVSQKNGNNSFIQMGIEIAESHHEKWDGSGYPYGLAGDAIPLSGRILALADVYDALRSKRCYKEPYSHEKALGIIREGSCKHFAPDIVACFLEVEAEFEHIWRSLNTNDE